MEIPDKNLVHSKIIGRVDDTGKDVTFGKSGIVKHKYVITFLDGYIGEFLLPLTTPLPAHIKQNNWMSFKIAYRSGTHPDEIELAGQTPATQEQLTGKPVTTSMAGHPAVTALAMAKDIAVAKINNGHYTTGENASQEIQDSLLVDADFILDWLKLKKLED